MPEIKSKKIAVPGEFGPPDFLKSGVLWQTLAIEYQRENHGLRNLRNHGRGEMILSISSCCPSVCPTFQYACGFSGGM